MNSEVDDTNRLLGQSSNAHNTNARCVRRTIATLCIAETTWRRVQLWFLIAAVLLGTINAVFLIGPKAIDPTNLDWLRGDPVTHYLGWAFLRDDPAWHFPPTFTTQLGYPLGITVSFTDSIPLLAVLLRPLSPILPEPFQYIGPYTCLLMVLQAYFGFRLCHILCKGHIAFTVVGGLFLLFAPAVTWRMHGHFALASHWLILAGLVQYFQPDSDSMKAHRFWPLFLIVALAGAINPYIGVLSLLIVLATLLRFTLERRCAPLQAAELAGLAAATLGVSLFVSGFVMSGSIDSYSGGGYRLYSMNLLAPLDPMGFGSILLRQQPTATDEQYEGYNYLGLGIILLLLLGLTKQPAIVRELGSRRLLPILAVSLLCSALAASPTVTLGSTVLLKLKLPWSLEQPLTAFRASGRLFWPVHYLLLLTAIALTYRLWRKRYGIVLLSLALVLQLFDLQQLRHSTYDTFAGPAPSPLVAPEWQDLKNAHSTLMVIPPWQCNPELTPGGLAGFAIFGMLASAQHMQLNSYYTGRIGDAERRLHCSDIPHQVQRGILDPTAAYIVDDRTLMALAVSAVNSHDCSRVDGFNLCIRAQAGGGWQSGWIELLPVIDQGRLKLGGNPAASPGLLSGWGPIESGGSWTYATPARLAFRIGGDAAQRPLNVRLKFTALMVNGRQGYRIRHRDRVIAEDSIIAAPGIGIQPLDAIVQVQPDPKGIVVLEVEPERLASPASQGINADSRTLGLALAEIVLEPAGVDVLPR